MYYGLFNVNFPNVLLIDWSQSYSSQKEIHEYMQGVAKKYKLYEQTQFNTEVVRASWKEDTNKWEIELKTKGIEATQTRYYDFM